MFDEFEVIRSIITKDEATEIYNYLRQDNTFINGDTTIPNTKTWYKNKRVSKLHVELRTKMEKITGKKLYTTYNYSRLYKHGDILFMHKDRPACEYSATLCLGYKGKNWKIKLLDKNNNVQEFLLKPGDCVVYKGCDVMHWRDMFEGKEMGQVFLHYVDKDGEFAWAKDDKKKQKDEFSFVG